MSRNGSVIRETLYEEVRADDESRGEIYTGGL